MLYIVTNAHGGVEGYRYDGKSRGSKDRIFLSYQKNLFAEGDEDMNGGDSMTHDEAIDAKEREIDGSMQLSGEDDVLSDAIDVIPPN